MSHPTTRKHPRTLNEAFPQDAAEWFEGPARGEGAAYKFFLWCIYAALVAVLFKFFN